MKLLQKLSPFHKPLPSNNDTTGRHFYFGVQGCMFLLEEEPASKTNLINISNRTIFNLSTDCDIELITGEKGISHICEQLTQVLEARIITRKSSTR